MTTTTFYLTTENAIFNAVKEVFRDSLMTNTKEIDRFMVESYTGGYFVTPMLNDEAIGRGIEFNEGGQLDYLAGELKKIHKLTTATKQGSGMNDRLTYLASELENARSRRRGIEDLRRSCKPRRLNEVSVFNYDTPAEMELWQIEDAELLKYATRLQYCGLPSPHYGNGEELKDRILSYEELESVSIMNAHILRGSKAPQSFSDFIEVLTEMEAFIARMRRDKLYFVVRGLED